jgi:hypothetical protein
MPQDRDAWVDPSRFFKGLSSLLFEPGRDYRIECQHEEGAHGATRRRIEPNPPDPGLLTDESHPDKRLSQKEDLDE